MTQLTFKSNKLQKSSSAKDTLDCVFGYIVPFRVASENNAQLYCVFVNSFLSEAQIEKQIEVSSSVEEISKLLFLKKSLSIAKFSSSSFDFAKELLKSQAIKEGFSIDE